MISLNFQNLLLDFLYKNINEFSMEKLALFFYRESYCKFWKCQWFLVFDDEKSIFSSIFLSKPFGFFPMIALKHNAEGKSLSIPPFVSLQATCTKILIFGNFEGLLHSAFICFGGISCFRVSLHVSYNFKQLVWASVDFL